jgi:hypothetical protein
MGGQQKNNERAGYYFHLATWSRVAAETAPSPEARDMYLELARRWELLARRLEKTG